TAYLDERDLAERLRDQAMRLPPLAAGAAPCTVGITYSTASAALQGDVASTFLHDGMLWLIDFSRRDAKHIDRLADQLDLLLRFALLALEPPANIARIRGVLLGPDGPSKWSSALDLDRDACHSVRPDLVRIVDTLLGLALRAPETPLAYFPRTSEAF